MGAPLPLNLPIDLLFQTAFALTLCGVGAGFWRSRPAARSQATPTASPQIGGELPLALFQQAIAHSANGVVICDARQPDLPIVYVSPSFEALTGYSADEALGKNCRFLQGQENGQLGLAEVRQALSNGQSSKVLLRNYRKDGEAFWNELTLSPLRDAQGQITHYIGSQSDVSHYLETFKALQESELRYRHLYDETPAMLHSVDCQGHIVSVNRYWLEKLGYGRHEVIGQPLLRFVAPDYQHKVAQILSNLEANVLCRDKLCQFVKKNGERMDGLLSTLANPQHPPDGDSSTAPTLGHDLGHSLGVLVDITERRKAKNKLRRNEALLRAINNLPPSGIFVMDCHTNAALFVNDQFYRIWGLDHLREAVTGGKISGEHLLTECLSQIDLGAFVAASTAQDFSSGNQIVEDEVPLLNGRTLRRIYGPVQENNTTFAYLYVFEDITERKQAVQKLAQATTAAEAASRAKSEFLANMSHELRSPLNAILGFSHLLQEADLTETQKEHLDIIYRSGEHLLGVINDILDISKIEAAQVVANPGEFDLYRLLDELQQMFYSAVGEKGLQLVIERSPDLPRLVCSDRLKLRQILINLLSNAVKFTPQGQITLSAGITTSEIQLRSKASAPSSSLTTGQLDEQPVLAFAVTDTGPGIAPEEQARLFEAFVQTSTGLCAHQGTGLGLTISQAYARLLGGDLTLTSRLGEGSTFVATIRAIALAANPDDLADGSPDVADSRPIIGLAPGQPNYRILVVDDVAINRKLLTHLLSNVGFEIREASNGQDAIASWQTWQPHLIWLDMRMPILDGAAATRQIRSLEAQQLAAGQSPLGDEPTRIIALTASAFEENRAAALADGCDDFVTKPIRAEEIFDKIAQHLGVRYLYGTSGNHGPDPTALVCQQATADSSTAASYRDLCPKPAQKQSQSAVLTPPLMAAAPMAWRQALGQAVLDLDEQRILALVGQLSPAHQSLAQAVRKCVKNMAYRQLLQVLQEAEAAGS